MKIIIITVLFVLSGCSSVNNFTKKQVDEFCSHSKEHQDIVILGLTDKTFEPHSIHIHCNSEYGFPEK